MKRPIDPEEQKYNDAMKAEKYFRAKAIAELEQARVLKLFEGPKRSMQCRKTEKYFVEREKLLILLFGTNIGYEE